MSIQCKIGDLVILKDFYSYKGIHTKRNVTEPAVGLVVKQDGPNLSVHWFDDLVTWERHENLIVISDVDIIGKKNA